MLDNIIHKEDLPLGKAAFNCIIAAIAVIIADFNQTLIPQNSNEDIDRQIDDNYTCDVIGNLISEES